jgi:hypothetical protein
MKFRFNCLGLDIDNTHGNSIISCGLGLGFESSKHIDSKSMMSNFSN